MLSVSSFTYTNIQLISWLHACVLLYAVLSVICRLTRICSSWWSIWDQTFYFSILGQSFFNFLFHFLSIWSRIQKCLSSLCSSSQPLFSPSSSVRLIYSSLARITELTPPTTHAGVFLKLREQVFSLSLTRLASSFSTSVAYHQIRCRHSSANQPQLGTHAQIQKTKTN